MSQENAAAPLRDRGCGEDSRTPSMCVAWHLVAEYMTLAALGLGLKGVIYWTSKYFKSQHAEKPKGL